MTDIGDWLFSSRSFLEYEAMFGLTGGDLRGRMLDCPGGAASFTAEAGARGLDVTAVDPCYGGDRSGLADRAVADAKRGNDFLTDPARAERFVWTFFSTPADHLASRLRSAALFGADLAARPERYLSGALPRLDLPDRSFDLVLSSHLLFTYAERLDVGFHLAALRELARVSRAEVRVFPLLTHVDGVPYPHLDHCRAELARTGTDSELRHGPTSSNAAATNYSSCADRRHYDHRVGPMSFEHVIAAPVERVWKVVTDIDGYVDRLTKVEAAVRLTDGPFGVGTQYRETRVVYGHPVTVENWITECDILRRYVIQANVDALAITEFMFTPTPD